jgi:hypothetical protein
MLRRGENAPNGLCTQQVTALYVMIFFFAFTSRLQNQETVGSRPELKFHDINLTKDSSLLIHAIHSPFYWQILKKPIFFSGFNNPYQKKQRTKKT